MMKNAAEATAICIALGENVVNHIIYKKWYEKFRQDSFLEDESRARRPQKIETDELQALRDIKSEKEFAEQLGKPCYTASHFCTFTYDGKGSEGRQMGSA